MSRHDELFAIGVGYVLLLSTKRIEGGLWANTSYLTVNDRILTPVDKCILGGLIARDAELGVYLVLELILIAIQMVRCDIEQNGNICLKIIAVI